MVTIFHIAERTVWASAQLSGTYRVSSLDTEGFIHLSTASQYQATANRYYAGRSDLVLLEVDPSSLIDLRYETSTNDELFPHLYSELSVAAVISVHIFSPNPDGSFNAIDRTP